MRLDVPILNDEFFERLPRDLRTRVPAHSPEWPDHRPAVGEPRPLIRALGLLLLTLAIAAGVSKALRAMSFCRREADVSAGGDQWLRVESLQETGPADKVFELDPATGEVRFGDGEHGQIPPGGLTVSTRRRVTGWGVVLAGVASVGWSAALWFWWCRGRGPVGG